jgi:hypothetical protein
MMIKDACLTSLEGLQRWFEVNQKSKDGIHPYFTVWRGNEPRQDRLIYRNSEISEADKAWDALQEIIELHAENGGLFRIFITYKPAHNIGLVTLLKMPSQNPYQNNQAAMSGMYGGGGMAFGMHGSIKDLIQEETSRALETERLRRRIEDLESEKDAAIGMEEKLMEKFFPVISRLVEAVGMKAIGVGPNQNPASQPNAAGIHGDAGSDNDEGYDYERLEPALDKLREVAPDIEDTMEKLARMAQKDPDSLRNLLQYLT